MRSPNTVCCNLNESSYPPLPAVAAVLHEQVGHVNRYPQFRPDRLRATIAGHLRVSDADVTVGPGATGVALNLLRDSVQSAAARGVHRPRLVTAMPTFDGYPIIAEMLGVAVDAVPLTVDGGLDLDRHLAAIGPDTVAIVLCSPHNPTGAVVGEAALRRFLGRVPQRVRVILDEAYVEYAQRPPDWAGLVSAHPGLVVLRTFSKAYGLAALRVGYAVASSGTIEGARHHELPFAVSPAAMAAVPVALAAADELAARVHAVRTERTRLAGVLASVGAPVLPSEANFVYLPGAVGIEVGRSLAAAGVIGKRCGHHGFRLTVADHAVTTRIGATLRRCTVPAA